MTTGKAMAQVGHAVQLFLMFANEADVQDWLDLGRPTHIRYATTLPTGADVIAVHDAGFTEVKPDSLTVAARWLG